MHMTQREVASLDLTGSCYVVFTVEEELENMNNEARDLREDNYKMIEKNGILKNNTGTINEGMELELNKEVDSVIT